MSPQAPDPLLALAIAGLLAVIAAMIFWPGRGLFWHWKRGLRATGRVLVEDAVKHLWDCEYQDYPGTMNSLAGALGMSRDRTT
jgi:DtxR family Mn-dependent transcriptional regulator